MPSHLRASAGSEELEAPAMIKTEVKRAQRSAAPSPHSGLPATMVTSPSTPDVLKTPSYIHSSSPETSPGAATLARQNFARSQANRIPDAVDLLEAYVREPTLKCQENLILLPEKDPYLHAYGLSMFVDNYAPDTEARDEMLSFQQADALLAGLSKFLNNDLLRGVDLGSTRQIGDKKIRSSLAVQTSSKLFDLMASA